MNPAYNPDLPPASGYAHAPAPPSIRHYQQQQQQQSPHLHQHPHQHQQRQPETQLHQLQHPGQRQQPPSAAHHHGLPQPQAPAHQVSHMSSASPAPHPHHHQAQHAQVAAQPSRAYDSQPLSAEEQSRLQEMMTPISEIDKVAGRKYQLNVMQQPQRARMCGFGDKDRRPITPPPCVRLVITDIATGKEVDCNDIDHSMFVLNVDLWSEDGTREVNLVRSSGGNPAISSTTPFSYSTLNGGDTTPLGYGQQMMPPSRDSGYNPGAPPGVGYVQDYQVQQGYGQAPGAPNYPPNGSYAPPQQYFPQHQGFRGGDAGISPLSSQPGMAMSRNGAPATFGTGMFTRNLIGSLAASAFRLQDCDDRIGIWFVLQDLSVRTEGTFRLRFSFVNVGPRSGAPRDVDGSKVNHGRAPILASCFSSSFIVYSAKKFPGVCDSTPLSKTFAGQGIKIPIRKDGSGKGGGDGGHDGGADDDDGD